MKKQLHVFLKDYPNYILKTTHSLSSALSQLNNGNNLILTTQTHILNSKWLLKGYRIFVYMIDNKVVEVTLDNVRIGQNLEKMVLGNVFGLAVEDVEEE